MSDNKMGVGESINMSFDKTESLTSKDSYYTLSSYNMGTRFGVYMDTGNGRRLEQFANTWLTTITYFEEALRRIVGKLGGDPTVVTLQTLVNRRCSDVLSTLRAALMELSDNYVEFNQQTDDGLYQGTIAALTEIIALCAAHPQANLSISL